MKLEMQMTEKDKKLLLVLGILLIVVCFGYWGIRPMLSDILEINQEIQEEEATKEANDEKLMDLAMLKVENEKKEEDIQDAKKLYFSMMSSDAIDQYFTNMVLDYDLQAYDLDIEISQSPCDLEPYQYSEKASQKQDTKTKSTDSDTDTGIYVATVQMRLGGDMEKLSTFVEDLSNMEKKLLVQTYSYKSQQNVQKGADNSYSVEDSEVLNITVDIYMCKDEG